MVQRVPGGIASSDEELKASLKTLHVEGRYEWIVYKSWITFIHHLSNKVITLVLKKAGLTSSSKATSSTISFFSFKSKKKQNKKKTALVKNCIWHYNCGYHNNYTGLVNASSNDIYLICICIKRVNIITVKSDPENIYFFSIHFDSCRIWTFFSFSGQPLFWHPNALYLDWMGLLKFPKQTSPEHILPVGLNDKTAWLNILWYNATFATATLTQLIRGYPFHAITKKT